MNINALIQAAHKNAIAHGFWEEVNLDRTIMLIVSEIGEAIESDRNGCHAIADKIQDYIDGKLKDEWFEMNIKDDFEDEVADIFIRIFDLCGQLGFTIKEGFENCSSNNQIFLYTQLRKITGILTSGDITDLRIEWAISELFILCYSINLDIEPFILAKMKYNAGREYLHGKRF